MLTRADVQRIEGVGLRTYHSVISQNFENPTILPKEIGNFIFAFILEATYFQLSLNQRLHHANV